MNKIYAHELKEMYEKGWMTSQEYMFWDNVRKGNVKLVEDTIDVGDEERTFFYAIPGKVNYVRS